MTKIKLKVKEYDKSKAKKYFVWYKFLEIFGSFLFFVGFYGLGFYVSNKFPVFITELLFPITGTYWNLWLIGFFVFWIIITLLFVGYLVIWIIYELLKEWVKGNWNMAKRKAETKKARKIREEEQKKVNLCKEIEEKEKDRKRYGYCVGDEVKYICKEYDATNSKRLGQKGVVGEINGRGNIYPNWNNGEEGGVNKSFINSSSFKFKQKPLPKKPKLSEELKKELKL